MTDGDKPAVRPQAADAVLDQGRQTESTDQPQMGRPIGSTDARKRKSVRQSIINARVKRARELKRIATAAGVEFFAGGALLLLQLIYKDPRQPAGERVKAANLALPYESPRLTAVAHSGSIGRTTHEEALDQLRKGAEQAQEHSQATKH